MHTFTNITEQGNLRVLVGMTEAELRRLQEKDGVLALQPQPGVWWTVVIENPGRWKQPKVRLADAESFMRNHYGVTKSAIVTMPGGDVADLLKCEQLVFHCSPDEASDLIVFVEKNEESLKASLPMFGIEPDFADSRLRTSAHVSVN